MKSKARQINSKKNKNSSAKINNKGKGTGKTNQGPPRQQSVAAAYSTGVHTQPPDIKSTGTSARIRHRELVGSITGTSAFFVGNGIALNPGISISFPWLSSQAIGWEQYHFHKLSFCYYTRTGTSTPGSVYLAPDYDAADLAPEGEEIMSSYQDCVEDAPWKDITCKLDEKAMHPDGPRKYIRSLGLNANLDIKTYDVGNMWIATIDGTAVNWGKLWVEYDVSFYTPQLPAEGIFDLIFESIVTTVPTSASMLGVPSSQQIIPGSTQIIAIVNEVITFLIGGQFTITYGVGGTTCTQTSGPIASNGAVLVKWFGSTAGTTVGSGTTQMYQLVNISTPQGGVLTFNNTLAGGNFAELSIVAVSTSFG